MTRLEWISYCVSGIQNCFPEIYYGDIRGKKYPRKSHWNRKNSNDFAVEVMNWTSTYDLGDSLTKLQKWEKEIKQGLPLDPTIPPEETLVAFEELEKQKEDANEAERRRKGKEQELLIQRYKEKIEQEKNHPETKKGSGDETETIGIKEIREKGTKSPNGDLSTAYDRLIFSWAGPSPSLPLFARGITADLLEKKSLSLEGERKLKIQKLADELRKDQKAFPQFYKRIRRFTPEEVMILTSADSGFTQSEVFVMTNPQGGMTAFPRQNFLGSFFSNAGKQLFGGFVDKWVSNKLANASGDVALMALGRAGGPVTTVAAVGIKKLFPELISKVQIWIKRNPAAATIIGSLGVGAVFFGLGFPALAAIPLTLGGFAFLGAASGGFAALGTGIGGFFSAVLTGLTSVALPAIGIPILIGSTVFPVLVVIIIFIINAGAYVVPPSQSIMDCYVSDDTEPPTASGVIFSSDGKYAYPMAPGNAVGEDCRHWDNSLATDIFPFGGNGTHAPVIAYTSGVIEGTSLNDSKGGKYIILAGDDGRFYYFAHNCAMFVKEGDRVKVGDVMATTDRTGSAATTPEHLHFAINSQSPYFVGGGNVCPSKDFAAKFSGYNRCSEDRRCAVPLAKPK